MQSLTIAKKPDGDDPDRIWLAEVTDDGKDEAPAGKVDAAYFPTRKAAEHWARVVYRL